MNFQYFAYLCDKIQKITEAVYRVTELLPDSEPLKWEIRKKSLFIFEEFISLKDSPSLESNNRLDKIGNLINKLVAFFPLITVSLTISGINFEILEKEYEFVKKSLMEEKQSDFFEKLFVTASANMSLSAPHEIRQKQEEKPEKSNGHSIRHTSIGQKKMSERQNIEKKDRKSKILDIIKEKEKKQVSIGEIAGIFTDCSEKTIQRDLLEMVDKGILTKSGDKRWRKYTMVSS